MNIGISAEIFPVSRFVNGRRVVHALIAALLALSLGVPGGANAQAWPTSPVRLVVPFGPGGTLDTLARLLAERVQPALGQPVVVENKPGAATRIGHEFVIGRPADGNTLILSSSSIAILAALSKSLPFDLVRDFEPVSLIAGGAFVLAVNSNSPIRSATEFVATARAKPGSITYGTSGVGAMDHLAGALMMTMTGIQLENVPYKGMGEVVQGVLGGQVNATFGSITPLLPHIRSGKMRALGLVSSTPSVLLPGVPTLAEAVPISGYEMNSWMGVLARVGTPRAVVVRLNEEFNRLLRDPQFTQERLLPLGIEPMGGPPERLGQIVRSDVERFRMVVREAKISTD